MEIAAHSFAPHRHNLIATMLPKCNSQKGNISATRIVTCIGTKSEGKTVPITHLVLSLERINLEWCTREQ
jgi:hypothetical protein